MIRWTKASSKVSNHWGWNICQICCRYHLCHLRV